MQIGKWVQTGLVLFTWIIAMNSQAGVTATVDRNTVSEFDVLTLTVRVTGGARDAEPDFSMIERDFEIINRQSRTNSSISIINGRQTSTDRTDYVLTLRARRQGQLTIPAIRIDGESTSPIPIRAVEQSAADARRMNQLVFFETSVDTDTTYVQGQIIYTVKLFYSEAISGDFPPPPAVDDALIETLEKEKRYETIVSNRRYYVLEKQYAIFPQRSGQLVIPRETFIGSRGRGGLFSSRQTVNAVSDKHTVNVETIPSSFNGDHWIPARAFTLSESWTENPPQFRVGEPINRILIQTVEGLSASLLPPLGEFELDKAKTYADPPESSQQFVSTGVIASTRTTIGIVPTEAGELILPEIRVPWWDTTANELKVAVIPGATYQVLPAPGESQPNSAIPGPAAIPEAITITTSSETPPFWMYVSMVLAALWLISVWQWLSTRSRLAVLEAKPVQESPNVPEARESVRFKALIKACKSNDPAAAHRHLNHWARVKFPEVESLLALVRTQEDQDFEQAIRDLELALFSSEPQDTWDGARLIAATTQIRGRKLPSTKPPALQATLNPL